MKRILAIVLALLCFGTAALSEIYIYTIADPTYVRSEPKIAKNIVKQLSPNKTYEWGGHIVYDDRGIAFYDIFYSDYKYGWVSSLHADLWDSDTNVAYTPSSDNTKNTSVFITEDVSMRSDAGSRYTVVGYLDRGTTVSFTGYKKKDSSGNQWYQVKYLGTSGWVPSSCAVIY